MTNSMPAAVLYGTRIPAVLCATLMLVGAGCSQVRSLGSEHSADAPAGPAPATTRSTTQAAGGARVAEDSSDLAGPETGNANSASAPALIDETGPDNPAGLSPEEVAELVAGGPAAQMRWLYPYDGTVFPGGTVAPLAMWTGNAEPDAVYLHMKSQDFEYRGVLLPGVGDALFQPGETGIVKAVNVGLTLTMEPNKQAAIPQAAWNAAAARTLGRGDTLLIEVTERVDGQVFGPVSTHVTIARGSLQGSIYYNSCLTGMQGDPSDTGTAKSGIGARIMRIPAGGNAETVSDLKQCVGCHTVSANGAHIVAQRAFAVGDISESFTTGTPAADYTRALSMPLSTDGRPDMAAATGIGPMGAYGALYPDGSMYLAASGQTDAGGLSRAGYVADTVLSAEARLVDSVTGIPWTDTGIPGAATMPMFSPDGTKLVFNDASVGNGSTLTVMSYDVKAHRATDYQTLVDLGEGSVLRPGWPFFLPDSQAVVFAETDSPDFSGTEVIPGDTASDLYIADIASGQVTLLARAMGFETTEDAAAGRTYLPFGAEELHRNYYPAVAPVANGGYFWVFFDSVRHFGSLGSMRMLWGAAIDVHPDGTYTTDPSHPPFYVPGQEFISVSHFRAFAALDRCQSEGAGCESGMDCCGGACRDGVCATATPDTCAELEERCESTADCCGPDSICINGFCSFTALL